MLTIHHTDCPDHLHHIPFPAGAFGENASISKAIATKQPYKEWVAKSVRRLEDMSPVSYPAEAKMENATLLRLQVRIVLALYGCGVVLWLQVAVYVVEFL